MDQPQTGAAPAAAAAASAAVRRAARAALAAWVLIWLVKGLCTLTLLELHDDDANLLRLAAAGWGECFTGSVGHPFLFLLFLRAWTLLGGVGDAWVRLPALAGGALTLIALYRFGERRGLPGAGLLAALAAGCALQFVRESQRAHVYSFFTWLSVLSWDYFLLALADSRRRFWALWAGCGAVGMCSHYFFAGNLVGQLAVGLAALALGPRRAQCLPRIRLAGRALAATGLLAALMVPEGALFFSRRLPRLAGAPPEGGRPAELAPAEAAWQTLSYSRELAYYLFFSRNVWHHFTGGREFEGRGQATATVGLTAAAAALAAFLLLWPRRPLLACGLVGWCLTLLFPALLHLASDAGNEGRRALFVLPAFAFALGVAAAEGPRAAGGLFRRLAGRPAPDAAGEAAGGPGALLLGLLLVSPWLYVTAEAHQRLLKYQERPAAEMAAALRLAGVGPQDRFWNAGRPFRVPLLLLAEGDCAAFRGLLARWRWTSRIAADRPPPAGRRGEAGGRSWLILCHNRSQSVSYVQRLVAGVLPAWGAGAARLVSFAEHWQVFRLEFGAARPGE